MTKEQYKEYNALFVGCWDLFKKYAVSAEEADQDIFWERYVNDEYELYKKHGFTPLAKSLLIASRKEVERLCRKGKNGNEAFNKG